MTDARAAVVHTGTMTRTPFRVALVAVIVVGILLALPRFASESTAAPALAAGTSTHSIDFDGRNRDFRVHRPATVTSSAPLVVVLHGGFGSARQAELSYGWNQQAAAGRFIVAYPDAIRRSWNAGTCCGAASSTNLDDAGFVEAVVHRIAALTPDRLPPRLRDRNVQRRHACPAYCLPDRYFSPP